MNKCLKKETLDKIVDIEWKMMRETRNVEGRLKCQEDENEFKNNRLSYFYPWDIQLLSCYKKDLEASKRNNINLVTNKYAYMMESTFPDEFNEIKSELPTVDDEKIKLIEEIWEIEENWANQLQRKYPYIMATGRPINSEYDSKETTSLETYFKGELKTYSEDLLKKLLSYYKEMYSESKNMHEESTRIFYKFMGIDSLEEANKISKIYIRTIK